MQGTETRSLLQIMFWANFQTLQGSVFLKTYAPTIKSVSKAKEEETLEYHVRSPELYRGKITKGFCLYQSVSLINLNMVKKPTWRSLGSCETWGKKIKANILRYLNKFWSEGRIDKEKKDYICLKIQHTAHR